ncbi:hypothetical protein ACF0H5_017545 [Mactra antiquata]
MQTWALILAGFVINGIVFISVFDIYFNTPLEDGLAPHKSKLPPPAKRLVFIVADGLRADKTLMLQPDGTSAAPFLRSIAENVGAWGVSTAGIPTATRPGHVAMTAGFYEDPTSVAKDIGGADLSFDDVFQDTTYTWSWDSPEVLDKVAIAHPDKMFSKKFPGARKYLSGIDPKDMDSWVFTEVKNFINEGKHDEHLKEKMSQDKVLFFLHLGGIDHAGYIVRPNSQRYLQHLRYLDDGIKDIVGQFEDFFEHDGKTAYIFTSDHGMTNWGAHGEGMPDEIHCPLIVWGSGIRKPIPEDNLNAYPDTLSQDWSMTKWKRTNIEQPSLAPLMASLIGVTYPMNAVYPFPEGFLDVPEEELFEIMYANLKQLLENYLAIEWSTHTGPLAFDFRKYHKLSGSYLTDIDALRDGKSYSQGIRMIREKTLIAVEGIQHYRLYSEVPLWIATFSSLFGWFCLCMMCLIQQHINVEDVRIATPLVSNTKTIILQCSVIAFIMDVIILYAQSTKFTNYLHFLLPLPIWTCVIMKWYEIDGILSAIKKMSELASMAAICVVGLCLYVTGLYYRGVMASLVVMLALWVYRFKKDKLDNDLMKYYVGVMIAFAIVCGKPTGDRDLNYNLALAGSALITIFASLVHKQLDWSAVKGNYIRHFGYRVGLYQICKIGVSTLILVHSSYLTLHDQRTPLTVQVPCWIILIVSIVEPTFVHTDVQSRLTAISLSIAAPYILLSIGQEPLSYLLMILALGLYVEVESHLTESHPIFLPRTSARDRNENNRNIMNGHGNVKQHKHTRSNDLLMVQSTVSEWRSLDFVSKTGVDSYCKKSVTTGDLRRGLATIIFCICGLIGAGHIVSINSFDVQDVFCFFTTHNPPIMGVLMVFKLTVSVMITFCFMRAANLATYTSLRNHSLIIFVMSSFVSMITFSLVTNKGTWTDIGEKVSHHLVIQAANMCYSLEFGLTHLLTTFRMYRN